MRCSVHVTYDRVRVWCDHRIVDYFEVTVVERGSRGQIALGVTTSVAHPLDTMAGYLPSSIALHLDDGKVYAGSSVARGTTRNLPECAVDATIGCGVVFWGEAAALAFWCANGKLFSITEAPGIMACPNLAAPEAPAVTATRRRSYPRVPRQRSSPRQFSPW